MGKKEQITYRVIEDFLTHRSWARKSWTKIREASSADLKRDVIGLMERNALEHLKTHLRPGRVYRREEFLTWSNAVDRHLKTLTRDGVLKKLRTGLYYCPRKFEFGEAPAEERKLVQAFLRSDRFVVTSPNAFNQLGLGTTQLYNKRVVYNQKRHGTFDLGDRTYVFHRRMNVPNHDRPAHIESRKLFFNALKDKIQIAGVTSVDRDHEYDDAKLRNAGLRLCYNGFYGSVAGLKDGILLKVGFDQTSPHQTLTISSWALDFAFKSKLDVVDNRAQEVICYNPEYTFVEKLQTVARKFRQFKESGLLGRNFLRHYYDIHQLLDLPTVQKFIGTPEYLEHKKKRFRSESHDLVATGAFDFSDPVLFKKFDDEYKKTEALYYRGQIPFANILARIKKDLARL